MYVCWGGGEEGGRGGLLFKSNLDRRTTHPRFHPIEIQTDNLLDYDSEVNHNITQQALCNNWLYSV